MSVGVTFVKVAVGMSCGVFVLHMGTAACVRVMSVNVTVGGSCSVSMLRYMGVAFYWSCSVWELQ